MTNKFKQIIIDRGLNVVSVSRSMGMPVKELIAIIDGATEPTVSQTMDFCYSVAIRPEVFMNYGK